MEAFFHKLSVATLGMMLRDLEEYRKENPDSTDTPETNKEIGKIWRVIHDKDV